LKTKKFAKLEATKTATPKTKTEPQKEAIQFEDFAKMDIRTGTILKPKNAESNKL
jgi:methionyl-tRNA synthetase